MDLKKYSKYLPHELFALLKDIEQAAGVEVNELPPINSVPDNARFLLHGGNQIKEYVKLRGKYYQLIGSASNEGGREIELQKSETHIQWRYKGDTEWIDIIALSEITGASGASGTNGRGIELQNSDTHIQWRYSGDELWNNLLAVADLKGNQGDPGIGIPAGGTAGQVLKKISSTDFDTQWVDDNGAGNSVNFNIVDSPQELELLSQNTGDWAYVNNIAQYVVCLGGNWNKLGNLIKLQTGTGNLYGESAHYDASAITGLSDGSSIDIWSDLSDNGYDASTPSTGPLYFSNQINGYPIVRFNGTSTSVMLIQGKVFGNSAADSMTIVIVGKTNNNATQGWLSTRPTIGSKGWLCRTHGNYDTFGYAHTGFSPVDTKAMIHNQFNIMIIRRTGFDSELGINSALLDSATTLSGFGSNDVDGFTQIGSEDSGTGSFLNGDIAEIFIFESALNNTLLATVINDLKSKYSLS